TEAVRRHPYSIVLLDEIQKAHPDVYNILLQVLDDGHRTDNKCRVVNCKNTTITMTTNSGAHLIQENCAELNEFNREEILAKTNNEVFELLKKSLRPEFLNRIDEVIMFTPLSRDELSEIVTLQFHQLQEQLKEMDIDLDASPEALDWLGQLGYDPQFGAR